MAASALQDGAAGATLLPAVVVDEEAFTTRENLGSGRLLGGGASAWSRSWTKLRATSCSRSSSASATVIAGGSGVARSSGFFFFCTLAGSVAGGLAGLLLLSLWPSWPDEAGGAAAGTMVFGAAGLTARGGAGGGG